MIRSQSIRPAPGLCTLLPGLLTIASGVASAQTAVGGADPLAKSASSDVTTYRGDTERTGISDCTVNFPLSVAWQNTTRQQNGNTSSPVIHDGVIFFGAGTRVYAMDAATGTVKWTYPGASTDTTTAPSTSPFNCPATVADGKVFIGNDDGKLYVIDEQTGESVWQVVSGGAIRTAPAVDGGTVFFGSLDGKLYAVREDNQQPLWGGQFKTTGPIITAPLVNNNFVYFTDSNNVLYCAAEASGRLLWSEKFDGGIAAPPLIFGDTLYITSDHTLYGVVARSGSTRWSADLGASAATAASISTDGLTVFIPTIDGILLGLNARGKLVWRAKMDYIAASAPIVPHNAVIVVTKSGVAQAFSPSDGHQIWNYSLHAVTPPQSMQYNNAGFITASPLVSAGAIYTLANDGTLTAFNAGAIDQLAPVADIAYPTPDHPVAGSQLPYKIYLRDIGTGINPASLVLKVDATPLPVEYKAGSDDIEVKTSTAGQLFGQTPVKLPTLTRGAHKLTLTVSDWRGNTLTKTWNFSVDSSLNAPGAPPAVDTTVPPASTATPATNTGTGTANTMDNGFGGLSGAAGINPGGSATGRSGSGGGGNGGGGDGGGISTTTGPGTGAPGAGVTPALPPPPAAPPGTGGNFPPPPPI